MLMNTRDVDKEIKLLTQVSSNYDSFQKFVHAVNNVIIESGESPISRQAVEAWFTFGVPVNRARVIEKISNYTKEQIRPDFYY